MTRFGNLAVLISGAAGGFGRAAAQRFSEDGARLVLTDIDVKRLEALAASLPGEVEILPGDVTDEGLHEKLVQLTVDRFGRLDIAVNNAGVIHDAGKLANIESEQARRVLDIDLLAVFFALKHQLAAMERQYRSSKKGGAIVNIASVAGLNGAPRLSMYAAAKHGVVGLTRSAAAEYASKGIRVNAVCPSYARTPMAAGFVTGAPSEDEAYKEMTRGVPMKRLAEIDEVVEAILYSADPKNSFMTGHALAIDGGIGAI